MTAADKDAVGRLGNGIHVAHQEDPDVLIERQRLCPEGCFVLEGGDGESGGGRLLGYLLSHPWIFAEPPALDSHLGALPAHPTTWYIHDLALLPETRGQGQAALILERLVKDVKKRGFATISLVAVSGTRGFWSHMGFTAHRTPALDAKLKSYGADARFMLRQLDSARHSSSAARN